MQLGLLLITRKLIYDLPSGSIDQRFRLSPNKVVKRCATYCPRATAMPVQHFMNPGQLYATETQPPLAPPSECVCCTAPHCLACYSCIQKPC